MSKQFSSPHLPDTLVPSDVASRMKVAAAVIVLLLVLALDVIFYPPTLEDAFITFRYSHHLSQGYGLGAWNASGAPVEGYTTPLWMLLLAIGERLGFDIVTLSKLLGIASHLGLTALFLVFGIGNNTSLHDKEFPGASEAFLMAACVVGFYMPIAWYASSGMETVSYMLLTALALLGPYKVRGLPLLAAVSALLVLIRPEGIVVAAACNALHYSRHKKTHGATRAFLPFISAVVTLIALLLVRWGVFRELLPNTYFAKAGGAGGLHFHSGVSYFRGWIIAHATWCLVLALTGIVVLFNTRHLERQWRLFLLYCGVLSLLGLAYMVKIGGDNYSAFPYWRHVLHLMPFLAPLLGGGIVILVRARWMRWSILVALLLSANLSILFAPHRKLIADFRCGIVAFPSMKNASPNGSIPWLQQITSRRDVIASPWAGEMPYRVDAVHIDILGLNDATIAHHGTFDPAGPIDSKTDMNSVMARGPDIIYGVMKASSVLDGRSRDEIAAWRGQMVRGLLDNPKFQSHYVFLLNGPYRELDAALFLRREYLQQHPQREQLHCIPVMQCSFYSSQAGKNKSVLQN